jgi:polar amino acid transport system substrate-binding protein
MKQILQTTTTRAASMKQRVVMLAVALAMDIALGMIGSKVLNAQQAPDPRVADLVRAGRVRVGLGLGTPTVAIKDPVTGEVRGPAVDLARALAARIGVELLVVEYPRPGAVMEGVRSGTWDVTFLGIDPARAAEADFSPPFMQYDLTYLVPAGSSIRTVADADQPGMRIAVPRGDISDLRLSRMLKRAELVRADIVGGAFDLLRAGQANIRAGVRPVLLEESARLPGSRILEDRFGVILVAMLIPKGHAGRLAYISEFVEEAKASGLVQRAIERAGLQGVQVAPAGNPSVR